MAHITISINSREYGIACEDGQEGRILQLSRLLDEKAKLLTNGSNQVSENMLLAMIGLLLADELTELKKGGNKDVVLQSADMEKLAKIDDEMTEIVKNLNNTLKTLAKRINSL